MKKYFVIILFLEIFFSNNLFGQVNCNDGNPCTIDSYDVILGCKHIVVTVDDHNLCTIDACNSVTGAIYHFPGFSNDNNACTIDYCDTNTGIYHIQVETNDNNYCTIDGCNSNTGAITSTLINTSDNNACTIDACDPSSGIITHTYVIINDDNVNTIDFCNAATGTIFHFSGVINCASLNINDGNACTIDGCNSLTGPFHTAIITNDNNPCTIDACDPTTGFISHIDFHSDNNTCTTDFCNSSTGIISHIPLIIDDQNPNTVDFCNSITGIITHSIDGGLCASLNIDDGNPCTADGCNILTGPFHNPIIISDDNLCTNDFCNSVTGVISHLNAADDYNVCTIDNCEPLLGTISHLPISTDDGDSNTIDICDPISGIIRHNPYGFACNGLNIDDGNVCTVDACNNITGIITHITVNVNDGNPCTEDLCDGSVGAIHHQPSSDHNSCTIDICDPLIGIISNSVNINDANENTFDYCDPYRGIIIHSIGGFPCSFVNVNDGNACTIDGCNTLTGPFHNYQNVDDGNFCTLDGCNTSTGVISHLKIVFDDGDPNSVDGCNSISGPFHNAGVIFPSISLNTSSILLGQNVLIIGTNCSPNETYTIFIKGPDGFNQTRNGISLSALGAFNYSYQTNSNFQAGVYTFKVKDDLTGLYSIIKSCYFKKASVEYNLEITFPTTSLNLDLDEIVYFEFIDKMNLGSNYPLDGSKRKYKYLIDISNDNGNTFQNLDTVQGSENINAYASLHYFFTPASAGVYKIKVTDFYNPSSFKISSPITVSNIINTNNIKIESKWDLSYPEPSIPIQGIAADGAARFFFVVSKINPNSGPSISNVSATLSDSYNGTDGTKLGRVKIATEYLNYSSEANGTNTITANISIPNLSKYVFWYLSPDDFVANNPNDMYSSLRTVNVLFTITYSNNSVETKTKKITIVRPPLMLVHGLASDRTTWDNFSNSSFGAPTKFLNDFRFKVFPINLSPNASFKLNAFKLTEGNPSDLSNSFQGVISEMRNNGYVTNRVDYVCHSMGGSVLRSVLDNYLTWYNRTGNQSNRPYKNYEKGYINKVITIGTPHYGSPIADIVNRYVDDIPYLGRIWLSNLYAIEGAEKWMPFMFVKLKASSPWYSPEFETSDAVHDLQMNSDNGGINFKQAYVRAHVIAGDIIPGRQLNLPGGLIPQNLIDQIANMGNNYLERFVNYLSKACYANENDPVLHSAAVFALSKSEPIDQALTFLDKLTLVLDAANYGTFMPESDLIVGVGSQLDGYAEFDPNVTIVDNFVAHAFIHNETSNLEIGNATLEMLNSPISSNKFNLLPATPVSSSIPFSTSMRRDEGDTLINKIDTTRIKIIQPGHNNILKIDSLITITILIKDSTNLKKANVYFQSKTYPLSNNLGQSTFNLQVAANELGDCKLTAEAFYSYEDSSVLAYDEIDLKVINHENINSFIVSPDAFQIFIGQTVSPTYNAIFQTYTIANGNFSDSIIVLTDDTNIVVYDSSLNTFKGRSVGETFSIISYLGKTDTIYFLVKNGPETSRASFSSNISKICNGSTVNFMNESFGSPINIKWIFSGGIPNTSTIENPSVTYPNSGTFDVTLIATYPDKPDTIHISNYVKVDSCLGLLNVTAFIEGYYQQNDQMKPVLSNFLVGLPPNITDSIQIDLHQTEFPYPTEYSSSSLINTSGLSNFLIPVSLIGQTYFISIKGRNTLEAWVSNPVTFTSSSTNLNLTLSANSVLGNNLKNLANDKYGLISGDIDGNRIIDLSDVELLKNEIINFTTGFNNKDLDGDGIIESLDYSLIENNIGSVTVRP